MFFTPLSRLPAILVGGIAVLILLLGLSFFPPGDDNAKPAPNGGVDIPIQPEAAQPADNPAPEAPGGGAAPNHSSLHQISNGYLRIEIDPDTGHVIYLDDLTKAKPVRLLDGRVRNNTYLPPFRVESLDAPEDSMCQPTYPPEIQVCAETTNPCRQIRWPCGEYAAFEGRVELVPGRPAARFSAALHGGNERIVSITYPVLGPLAPLSNRPERDTLAIPYEGGMLVRNPIQRARDEVGSPLQVLRGLRYPYGHAAMLQMLSYQSPDRGGFLIYTPDPNFTVKRFSLVDVAPQAPKPWAMLSVEHMNWDVENIEHKGGMSLDYPVEIAALATGDWHEAADIYRKWGERQVWARSPIAERAPEDRRLFETAAVSVFGLSARENQTEWYRAFHDAICDGIPDTRVLFVPGWDFHPNGEMAGEPISAFYQAGWEERFWLPFQGDFPANHKTMKGEHDDFVYPFLFDMLMHDQFPGWNGFDQAALAGKPSASWAEMQIFDQNGEPGGFVYQMPTFPGSTHTLNPANSLVREFHRWRTELLLDSMQDGMEIRLDGTYHDISTTIATLENYGDNSDVPYKGAGRWMIEATREMYAASLGSGVSRGTSTGIENVTEPFIDQIDFYHLGAEGLGPIRSKTPDSPPDAPLFNGLHQWVMDGNAVNIPLVSFVYHSYGALRTGGKVQISYEMGDVFYWITASEYLWGGILELIYFNTPTDLLPGIDPDKIDCPGGYPCAYMTAWSSADISPRGWHYNDVREADPAKIDFLRLAARLRIEYAPEFLTTGRMLVPPRLDQENEAYEYDYDFYSSILGDDFNHYGTYRAPAVLAEAWETWDGGKKAFLMANPTAEEQHATLTFDPATYGFDRVQPVLVDPNATPDSGLRYATCEAGESCILYVPLGPRSFYLVNLETLSPAGG